MDSLSLEIILALVNAIFAVLAFAGGFMLKNVSDAIKDLRRQDEKLVGRMDGFAHKTELQALRQEQQQDLREMRQEQRENFDRVFVKLDQMAETMGRKVDRSEIS